MIGKNQMLYHHWPKVTNIRNGQEPKTNQNAPLQILILTYLKVPGCMKDSWTLGSRIKMHFCRKIHFGGKKNSSQINRKLNLFKRNNLIERFFFETRKSEKKMQYLFCPWCWSNDEHSWLLTELLRVWFSLPPNRFFSLQQSSFIQCHQCSHN